MSNPDYLPPWGCPWHGLIRSGVLTLPNGETVEMIQPEGATAALRHPQAPGNGGDEAPRTDGRQWWPAAILCGLGSASPRLHGRPIAPLRWLYIDPAGEVWGVEHNLTPTSYRVGSATFTLRRFGVLGGKPESYSYIVPVSAAGLGQPDDGAGEFNVADTTFWLRHANAVGSGAIMQLAYSPGSQTALSVGWFEIRLAGGGRSCTITLQPLATRARTMGVDRTASTSSSVFSYVNEASTAEDTRTPTPPCTGRYRRTTNYVMGANQPGLARVERKESRAAAGRAEWIYAMWYDEAGAVQEVQASWGYTSVATMAPPAVSTDSPEITGYDNLTDGSGTSCYSSELIRDSLGKFTLSQEGEARIDIWIRLKASDGTEVEASRWRHRVWSSSHTYSQRISGGIPVWDVAGSITIAEDWVGGNHQESTTPSTDPSMTPTGYAGPLIDPWVIAWELTWPDDSGGLQLISADVVRHAGQLAGIRERSPDHDLYQHIVTPRGAETLDAISVDRGSALYVSYCPVTYQIARDTVPVCWT